MTQAPATSPRPRRTIEDTDEFFTAGEFAQPVVRPSRFARGAIAVSAVTAVSLLAFAAPGLALASVTGKAVPSPVPTTAAPSPGSVAAFAARGTSTDRDAVRESLSESSVQEAAGARSEALSAQGEQVVTTQQEAAVATRASGLDATSTQIKAESDRLLSFTFFKPTDGGITSEWGMRYHPILHYTRMHAGLDMGGACGQPIWAARDGVVTQTSSGSQSGNEIRIDHGSDSGSHVETAYLHMQSFAVKAGDKVKRGQVIGWVGSTGLSTACHLHFAVYDNGENVNPRPFLGL